MAFENLSNVLSIFSRSSSSQKTEEDIYREVLLKILAQASKADANIHPEEIETIKKIMQRETDQEITEADIRKASRSASKRVRQSPQIPSQCTRSAQ